MKPKTSQDNKATSVTLMSTGRTDRKTRQKNKQTKTEKNVGTNQVERTYRHRDKTIQDKKQQCRYRTGRKGFRQRDKTIKQPRYQSSQKDVQTERQDKTIKIKINVGTTQVERASDRETRQDNKTTSVPFKSNGLVARGKIIKQWRYH